MLLKVSHAKCRLHPIAKKHPASNPLLMSGSKGFHAGSIGSVHCRAGAYRLVCDVMNSTIWQHLRRWKARGVFSYSADTARDRRKTLSMRISQAVFIVAIFVSPIVCLAQAHSMLARQTSTAGPAAVPTSSALSPPAAPPAPAVPSTSPSGILRPSFETVLQTLGSLRVERWKKGSVREEANDNVHALLNDIQTNLPPLMKDADAGPPGSLSKVLPLARHVDALYDVLLRVVEAARIAAPDEQASDLRQALGTLGRARLALDDRMEETATIQEKQVSDLRVTVEKQAAFKCPAPTTPATTAPKKVVRKKPAPATTAPGAPPGTKPQTTPQKPSPSQPAGTTPKTGR
jgi:hypothetical protein